MELFTIYEPTTKVVPLIANLPHSGMFVPQDIAANFTPEHLHPDFSPRLKKEGSKTAKMYIAKESQQFEV